MLKDLICPNCYSKLELKDNYLICENYSFCNKEYPIIDNIPILINESNSIFRISDFENRKETTLRIKKNKFIGFIKKLIPSISSNLMSKRNYRAFEDLVLKINKEPRILVIGGGILGEGLGEIIKNQKLHFIESDVSFGPRTQIIFDAHNIPFPDNYFDGVIIQAVLEHVVDPIRCVEEIHRVLKRDGIVYAETPFIQQVHMGKYDFQRFTHLGHRRLFRKFEEIESGICCGPGMALAWSYCYFFFSFCPSKKIRNLLLPFLHLTSFFWKFFDKFLINKPGAFDAASGFYFLGRKSDNVLSDLELLKSYRGLL